MQTRLDPDPSSPHHALTGEDEDHTSNLNRGDLVDVGKGKLADSSSSSSGLQDVAGVAGVRTRFSPTNIGMIQSSSPPSKGDLPSVSKDPSASTAKFNLPTPQSPHRLNASLTREYAQESPIRHGSGNVRSLTSPKSPTVLLEASRQRDSSPHSSFLTPESSPLYPNKRARSSHNVSTPPSSLRTPSSLGASRFAPALPIGKVATTSTNVTSPPAEARPRTPPSLLAKPSRTAATNPGDHDDDDLMTSLTLPTTLLTAATPPSPRAVTPPARSTLSSPFEHRATPTTTAVVVTQARMTTPHSQAPPVASTSTPSSSFDPNLGGLKVPIPTRPGTKTLEDSPSVVTITDRQLYREREDQVRKDIEARRPDYLRRLKRPTTITSSASSPSSSVVAATGVAVPLPSSNRGKGPSSPSIGLGLRLGPDAIDPPPTAATPIPMPPSGVEPRRHHQHHTSMDGNVGVLQSPSKGRRIALFQATSEESFEQSLMAGGYPRTSGSYGVGGGSGGGGSDRGGRERGEGGGKIGSGSGSGGTSVLSDRALEWLRQVTPPHRLLSLGRSIGGLGGEEEESDLRYRRHPYPHHPRHPHHDQQAPSEREVKKRKRMAAFLEGYDDEERERERENVERTKSKSTTATPTKKRARTTTAAAAAAATSAMTNRKMPVPIPGSVGKAPRLVVAEVEGRGRVLVDPSLNSELASQSQQGAQQQDQPESPPTKKRGGRRKRGGRGAGTKRGGRGGRGAGGSGLGADGGGEESVAGGGASGETMFTRPNWLDSEFPWSMRVKERKERTKREREEKLRWIERFLDRNSEEDTDPEDQSLGLVVRGEDQDGEITGSDVNDPENVETTRSLLLVPRVGRGKMVPLKANPSASSQDPLEKVFIPSDPADARAALLSKRFVRAWAFRRRQRQHKMRAGEERGEDEEEEVVCICRGTDDGRELVQCDECKTWYHLECIGIQDISELGREEDPWYCGRCVMAGASPSGGTAVELMSEPTLVPTDTEPFHRHRKDPLFFQSSPHHPSPSSPWPWTMMSAPAAMSTPTGRGTVRSGTGTARKSRNINTPSSSSLLYARTPRTPVRGRDLREAFSSSDTYWDDSSSSKVGPATPGSSSIIRYNTINNNSSSPSSSSISRNMGHHHHNDVIGLSGTSRQQVSQIHLPQRRYRTPTIFDGSGSGLNDEGCDEGWMFGDGEGEDDNPLARKSNATSSWPWVNPKAYAYAGQLPQTPVRSTTSVPHDTNRHSSGLLPIGFGSGENVVPPPGSRALYSHAYDDSPITRSRLSRTAAKVEDEPGTMEAFFSSSSSPLPLPPLEDTPRLKRGFSSLLDSSLSGPGQPGSGSVSTSMRLGRRLMEMPESPTRHVIAGRRTKRGASRESVGSGDVSGDVS